MGSPTGSDALISLSGSRTIGISTLTWPLVTVTAILLRPPHAGGRLVALTNVLTPERASPESRMEAERF